MTITRELIRDGLERARYITTEAVETVRAAANQIASLFLRPA